nr:uncharacterized protein LOC113828344 [Penaeus vannamei]
MTTLHRWHTLYRIVIVELLFFFARAPSVEVVAIAGHAASLKHHSLCHGISHSQAGTREKALCTRVPVARVLGSAHLLDKTPTFCTNTLVKYKYTNTGRVHHAQIAARLLPSYTWELKSKIMDKDNHTLLQHSTRWMSSAPPGVPTADSSRYEHLLVTLHEGVRTITFNRPEKKNALNEKVVIF